MYKYLCVITLFNEFKHFNTTVYHQVNGRILEQTSLTDITDIGNELKDLEVFYAGSITIVQAN